MNKVIDCEVQGGNLLKIPAILYGYIFYIAFLSITDVFALPLYYLNANNFLPAAIGIALALTVVMAWWYRTQFAFSRMKTNRSFYLYVAIILVIALIRSIIPDLSHDVSQGRVFWQTPYFVDNVNCNVFPAGFTFFFPLSDRIFYYPRILLGYRLGTLGNAFLLLLIYYQVVGLTGHLLKESQQKLREKLRKKSIKRPLYDFIMFVLSEDTLAFLSVMLFYSIADLGTYMVDLFGIPLLLWLLNITLIQRKGKRSFAQLLFVAMVCGILFAMKITNIIFIAPLLLVFIYQSRQSIKFRTFLLCFLVGIIPATPYLLYAYTSTGNPVYWTFNAVFKSPFYPDKNFKDTRWGPSSWKEFLLWPVHLIMHPTERVSEISKYSQIYLLLGWIATGVVAVRCLLKKRATNLLAVTACFVGFTILWQKSTGYPRYAILCEMLAAIVLIGAVFPWIVDGGNAKRIIAITLLATLTIQCAFNTLAGALNLYDWGWRDVVSWESLKSTYADNAKYLLKDRGLIGTEEQRNRVDFFLSTNFQHSMMKAMDPDAPIINGSYVTASLASVKQEKGIDYADYYLGKIAKNEANGAGIYDMTTVNNFDNLCDNANMVGAEIVSLEEVSGYFIGRDTPLLIGYSMTGKVNTCTELRESQIIQLPENTKNVQVKGIICIPSYVRWEIPDAGFQIKITHNAGATVFYKKAIPNMEYFMLDEIFSLDGLKGDISISISDPSGNKWCANVINLEVNAQ
ncbi:hypothetical protein RWV98_16145 [Agathobaculum sp. NTUH-O15-33]|uniref:hypothetical protein n=1 Tax=Agathobaculum sp. NTUH-O15-33 TaxID=3079302 RepID=UPI002958DA72|nr:hypothetical protein [Agathobaculum sp. NTUH-O15-33]WNX84091.1 hypothetical protein RWV98_16145 [Agathobaculum sp. NTUH-O15-33]